MAFTLGKRCSLCGGKLDSNLRCKECGLDNTKNDSMYKELLNQSKCDGQPLTHVHQHEPMSRSERERLQQKDDMQQDLRDLKHRLQQKYGTAGNTYNANTYTSRTKSSVNKKTYTKSYKGNSKNKKGIAVGTIFLILSIVSGLIGLVESLVDESFSGIDDLGMTEELSREWLNSDDYDYVAQLMDGFYTVGVHLPAGTYDLQFVWGDYTVMDIFQYDGESFHYLDSWAFEYDSDTIIRGLELQDGMLLKLSQNSCIECLSNTIAYDETYGIENPLTDSYIISRDRPAVAGQDFPAGVYDIWYSVEYRNADEENYESENYEYGTIEFEIFDNQSQSVIAGDSLYTDSEFGDYWYNNVPLTEGSTISVEGVTEIYLVPSVQVSPEMAKWMAMDMYM